MPRRFAYKEPARLPPPKPADCLPRIGLIVVDGRRPGGVVEPVTLDLTRYRTAVLARELGQAWAARFAGEAEPSFATACQHKKAVADLLAFCDRTGAPAGLSCQTLTAGLLDDWQDDAAVRYPPGSSRMAGQNAGIVFALLRSMAARDPGSVAPGALARARKPAAHPNSDYSEPLCEFSGPDLRRLIPAAARTAWETEQRILAGRQLIARGGDPRRSGRWTFPDVVWLAARGELTVALLRSSLPGSWRHWDDSLRERAAKTAGDNRGGNIGQLVKAAYQHVFPHPLDLVGHFVLIALDTAAWPEGVADLTVTAVRSLRPGTAGVELVKNRLPGSIEKLARDAGPAAARLRDTGNLLRSLTDITSAGRARSGSDMLFVAGVVHPQWEGVKVGPVAWSGRTTAGTYFAQWVMLNGLSRPMERTTRRASGEESVTLPALSKPWDPRRLRKTTLSHYGEHHPGEMSAWRDNTLTVFQKHYVTGSVIFKSKIGRLARQAAADLAEMVTRRTGFTVLTPEAAAEVRAETSGAAQLLRLDRVKLHQLATGGLDVDGGIAACMDLRGSPFARPGDLCRSARLGLCLACPNAVLTPDHIPGLRRFDSEIIEQHRRMLDPAAFAQRWVPIRRAVRWALGQLGAPVEEGRP
ncbi:MAG TPA: hypothetical protein VIV12_04625 [Streptosporangiaceae bacterium]